MYKWKVKIYMISGATFDGIIDSKHENTNDVAEELLCGRIGKGTFYAINDEGNARITCFRIAHVSAMNITPAVSSGDTK